MSHEHLRRIGRSVGIACAALLFGAGTASAVDGVIEINDVAVNAAGGYPFVIGATGSYVLTGNLTPPPATGGLVVAAPSVEIDLNGFALIGLGGGAARGIDAAAAAGTVVKDGSITGFGGEGIVAALDLKVFRTRIANNGGGITGAIDCLVVENTVFQNQGVGVDASNCKIENNVIAENFEHGIRGAENVIVHNKIANNGFGAVGGGGILSQNGSTIQENLIVRNAQFGISDIWPFGAIFSPPGIPFPVPGPVVGITPNHVMKNVIDGDGGVNPSIGVYSLNGGTLITDNTISNFGADGIQCAFACTIRGNQVHGNNLVGAGNGGVTAGPGSQVDSNSISFNLGIGLVIDPTARWGSNNLDGNIAQDMSLFVPPAAAAHASSGLANFCSGVVAPVPGVGPGACP